MRQVSFRGLSAKTEADRKGLNNPERGFRFEIGVGRIPADPVKFGHVRDQWPFPRYTADGVRVAQAYCYLTQYFDSPIHPEKLDALQADFDRARADGVKFLLRFAYEFDGYKNGPDCDQVCAHIQQLQEIVRRNMDVIYVLQIGWVGLWGEFHTSIHGLEKDPEAVARIVSATLELLQNRRFTMMRRMQYKADVLKTLGDDREITAETAGSAAPHARIGFFNDGTLANYWDGGTFWDPPHAAAGNPEFDRAAREGSFMPVDGELFWIGQESDGHLSGLEAAERFTHHHYTTFSLVHGFSELDRTPEEWAIDRWKQQAATPELLQQNNLRFDPAYFEGGSRTMFEYIRDHLGYRIALTEARFDETAAAGKKFSAEITLKNYGFAAPVNDRPLEFVLLAQDGTAVELTDSKLLRGCADLQPCIPGGCRTDVLEHKFAWQSVLPNDLPPGPLKAAIWLPDAESGLRFRADYAIRLATEIPVEIRDGRLLHILGEISR